MLSGRSEREVVVTGLGVVAPGACGVDAFRSVLRAGNSVVELDEAMRSRGFGCHVSARAKVTPEALARTFSELEQRRGTSSGLRSAVVAGMDAFHDAGLEAKDAELYPTWSVVFGVGVPGIDTLKDSFDLIDSGQCKRLGSGCIEMQMPSSAAATLAARLGAGGPATTVASACASGTEALLIGVDRIRRGLSDVVLTGSVEAEGHHLWGSFDALRVLTRGSNGAPGAASRPLSATAAGFVPASGSGALLLESREHAERRGARIYAEVRGGFLNCGARRNGGSMTAPNPLAMRLCIERALKDAEVSGREIDLVSGHLTATAGDLNEVAAWCDALRRGGADFPWLNAPKSIFGHALSGSGALELVACALELHDGFMHPSLNCEDLHPGVLAHVDAGRVVRELMETPLTTVIKASFGFGDVNACAILRRV